jgi:hypothetical protein
VIKIEVIGTPVNEINFKDIHISVEVIHFELIPSKLLHPLQRQSKNDGDIVIEVQS